MRNRFFNLLIFLILIPNSYSQSYFSGSQDSIEVGIVEHLGETIPLGLAFQNEEDSTVQLINLINKPTVLTFVYFDCPGLCSPLLDGVSDVIEKTGLELGKDYQVITISFNYRDTPAKAKTKKQNFLRKHSRQHAGSWIYLTGDSANIYKIVDAVGFKFKQTGLDYIHAAAIMVVSPRGKITRYLYGVTFLPLDLKMAIIEAQKGLSRPTINKVLEFCYAYDPAGRRYVLDVMKVSATLILFIIVLFAGNLFLRSRTKSKKKKQS
jgi:protein SCO1/2